MSGPADSWLDAPHDALRHPERFVGHSIRGRLFLRLAKGPATMDELAAAGWGGEWTRPVGWEGTLRAHLSVLRRETGRVIRFERRYVME